MLTYIYKIFYNKNKILIIILKKFYNFNNTYKNYFILFLLN